MSEQKSIFHEKVAEIVERENWFLRERQLAHAFCNACRQLELYDPISQKTLKASEVTQKLLNAAEESPEKALDAFCSPEVLPIANSFDLKILSAEDSPNITVEDRKMQDRLLGAFKHDNIGYQGELIPRDDPETNIIINVEPVNVSDEEAILVVGRKRNLIKHNIGQIAVTLGKYSYFAVSEGIMANTVQDNRKAGTPGFIPRHNYKLRDFETNRFNDVLFGDIKNWSPEMQKYVQEHRNEIVDIACVYYVDAKNKNELNVNHESD